MDRSIKLLLGVVIACTIFLLVGELALFAEVRRNKVSFVEETAPVVEQPVATPEVTPEATASASPRVRRVATPTPDAFEQPAEEVAQ